MDQLYAADVADQGYVVNYTRVFALWPEVLAGWAQLNGAIMHGMDLRRYELLTLAAARALRSTYCTMAHGRLLRDRFYDPETVRRIATDHTRAGLAPAGGRGHGLRRPGFCDALRSIPTTSSGSAPTGCPTPTSSTWPSPPRPGASSARCSTRWAPRLTVR